MSTSEQTSDSKRAAGYYWVRNQEYWKVARFSHHHFCWHVTGSLDTRNDDNFDEIDERRIERPTPQQQPDTMNDAVLKRQSEMMEEIAKTGWNPGQPDELSKAQARPVHIQKLFDEAESVPFQSAKYWELRCRYREKMDDQTYGQDERDNCFQLWRLLINR